MFEVVKVSRDKYLLLLLAVVIIEINKYAQEVDRNVLEKFKANYSHDLQKEGNHFLARNGILQVRSFVKY